MFKIELDILMDDYENDMREWLLECFEDEYDQEQIRELTLDQVINCINRYYDGGFKAFVEVSS